MYPMDLNCQGRNDSDPTTNGKWCLKRGDNPKKREMKGGDNPPQKREVKGGDNPLLTSCRPSSPLSPTSPPTFPLKQTSFKRSSLIWAKFHKSHFTEFISLVIVASPRLYLWLHLPDLYRSLSSPTPTVCRELNRNPHKPIFHHLCNCQLLRWAVIVDKLNAFERIMRWQRQRQMILPLWNAEQHNLQKIPRWRWQRRIVRLNGDQRHSDIISLFIHSILCDNKKKMAHLKIVEIWKSGNTQEN